MCWFFSFLLFAFCIAVVLDSILNETKMQQRLLSLVSSDNFQTFTQQFMENYDDESFHFTWVNRTEQDFGKQKQRKKKKKK